MSYTLDIPNAPNNPSRDQPLMKANTNAVNTLINQDHVTFNFSTSGYHKVIHQTIQTVDPITISGVNQVYAKNVTPEAFISVTDTQLFTKTGTGVISQLTGTQLSVEGYAWVSGILVQWGELPSTSIGSIVFKNRTSCIPYPTNIFTVVPGLKSNGFSFSPASVGVQNLSLTGFDFRITGISANWVGAYWIAIGN